jgi:preprotein translocase subunit SecE
MAKQTRSQRRARREAQAQSQAQGFSQRARARQAQVRPAQQQVKSQAGRKEAPRGSFIRESIAELRKVEWPNQRQVIQGTVVVLIACAIVGFFLWVNDLVWQRVVEQIL